VYVQSVEFAQRRISQKVSPQLSDALLYIHIYIYIYLYLFIYIYLYLFIYIYIYIYLYIYLYIIYKFTKLSHVWPKRTERQ